MNETRTDKFTVSVEKVVNLGNFESIRVGLSEIVEGAEKPEDVYKRVLDTVNSWTSQLKPAKALGPVTQPVKTESSPGPVATVTVAKPQPLTSEDPYFKLAWIQSQKKATLSTMVLSPELLENPVAKDLYEKLKLVGTLKVGNATYKISEFAGKTFLQKWSAQQLG